MVVLASSLLCCSESQPSDEIISDMLTGIVIANKMRRSPLNLLELIDVAVSSR